MKEPKRCPKCQQPITKDWKALWCYVDDCPSTKQKFPTQEQMDKYALTAYTIPKQFR